MTNYKTESKLRFRVTEDAEAVAAGHSQSDGEDHGSDCKTELCRSNSSSSNQTDNQTENVVTQAGSAAAKAGAAELMDIINDPHSPEEAWLAACNELGKQTPITRNRSASDNKTRKLVLGLASAVLILASSVGTAAFFHWGPFAPAAINFGPYMVSLQHQIKDNWHPPAGSASNKIAIHFKVHQNGEISDVGFDRLSRLSEADAAALKAVIESMPSLGPLPNGSPESVDVQFNFEYNVNRKARSGE